MHELKGKNPLRIRLQRESFIFSTSGLETRLSGEKTSETSCRLPDFRERENRPFFLYVCEVRDVIGLYEKAKEGKISQFTRIDSSQEEPKNMNIVIDTSQSSIDEFVNPTLKTLDQKAKSTRPHLVNKFFN